MGWAWMLAWGCRGARLGQGCLPCCTRFARGVGADWCGVPLPLCPCRWTPTASRAWRCTAPCCGTASARWGTGHGRAASEAGCRGSKLKRGEGVVEASWSCLAGYCCSPAHDTCILVAGGVGTASAGGLLAGPPLALRLVCAGQLLLAAKGEAAGAVGWVSAALSQQGAHVMRHWQRTGPALSRPPTRLLAPRSTRQRCATSSARCSWTPRCPTPTRWRVRWQDG